MTFDYDELIERYKHPLHKGIIKNASHSNSSNPSCGDTIILYVLVDDANRIANAKFTGSGCVLSQAAADILCDHIIGNNYSDACALTLSNFINILGFTPSISRIDCIKTPLHALADICKEG